nr:hypothetical protein [Tanacetum cinerariifolium]
MALAMMSSFINYILRLVHYHGSVAGCYNKLVLVDGDGKPLKKVEYPANSDNDDEVEPVANETTRFLASKGVGYGPKSLWKQ